MRRCVANVGFLLVACIRVRSARFLCLCLRLSLRLHDFVRHVVVAAVVGANTVCKNSLTFGVRETRTECTRHASHCVSLSLDLQLMYVLGRTRSRCRFANSCSYCVCFLLYTYYTADCKRSVQSAQDCTQQCVWPLAIMRNELVVFPFVRSCGCGFETVA